AGLAAWGAPAGLCRSPQGIRPIRGDRPMRAWSVAVVTQSAHGMGVSTLFALAPVKADAVAACVRNALAEHKDECDAKVVATHAREIDPGSICAAADEIRLGQAMQLGNAGEA